MSVYRRNMLPASLSAIASVFALTLCRPSLSQGVSGNLKQDFPVAVWTARSLQTAQPDFIDLGAKITGHKLYFIPQSLYHSHKVLRATDSKIKPVYLGVNLVMNPTLDKQVGANEKGAILYRNNYYLPKRTPAIYNRVEIEAPITGLLGHGYEISPGKPLTRDTINQLPSSSFILRQVTRDDMEIHHSDLYNAGSEIGIELIDRNKGDVKLYVPEDRMSSSKAYLLGVCLFQNGKLHIIWQSKNENNRVAQPLTYNHPFLQDTVSPSQLEAVPNADILTSNKPTPNSPNARAASIRFTLDVNSNRETIPKTNLAITGKEVVATEPKDLKSQLSLYVGQETAKHETRAYQSFYDQVGFLTNQIFSTQQLRAQVGGRLSFFPINTAAALDDILNKGRYIEVSGLYSRVLRSDMRVSAAGNSHRDLAGTRVRLVYVAPITKDLGVNLEYKFYLFPVSTLRGGYAIHDIENFVELVIPFHVNSNKFSVGYQYGLDESTFGRVAGQFVFNVKLDF